MAFSTVLSACVQGLRAEMVHVEADVSSGLPMFHMVGYLSSEVKEAGERIRTAIRNSEIQLPAKKVVVNLAPATLRKKGASFDLPIALAVLASLGVIPGESLTDTLVIGELGLDGRVQGISGILPMAMAAREQGCNRLILPGQNEAEGALVEGLEILAADHLKEICLYLNGDEQAIGKHKTDTRGKGADGKNVGNPEAEVRQEERGNRVDFQDIRGQQAVKRAAEVAVAGGHNLLMIGPPGSGKSMIAKRIPTILPPLTAQESMEITKIYSVLGQVDETSPLMTERPFRSVHHTVTKAALIGGGIVPIPGEISLAHGGVLFLDELAEFQKSVLEVLRQPLEEHTIRLTRSQGNYEFPANFMLAAAMNPCACGNYPDLERCNCLPHQIQQYLGRISQPFLDRIDICVEVQRTAYEAICIGGTGEDRRVRKTGGEESSETIRRRVCSARTIQLARYANTGFTTNAMLGIRELEQYCRLGDAEEHLMEKAYEAMHLTARTYHKVLKVARTIADLEGSERVKELHLMEAIGYRTMDKKYWGR